MQLRPWWNEPAYTGVLATAGDQQLQLLKT